MRTAVLTAFAVTLSLGLPGASALAQQHRATRLGNPATRFAKPLRKPDELRVLLRSDKARADVAAVLKDAGWPGDLADFDRAAATAEIVSVQVPPGTTISFMAARKKGKAYAMKDVLWAGAKPIEAFGFEFTSGCTRYRLVTPKACSNFWLETLGKDTTSAGCAPVVAPAAPVVSVSGASEACVAQPVEYMVTVRNPPADGRVALLVNGKELVSDRLTNGSFKFTFTGAPTPGAYEVKAVSGGVSSSTTVQIKACVPSCGITATPLPAKAGKPFTVDLSGSRVASGVRGGVRSAKVEVVDAKGAVVETLDMGGASLSRSDVVIKKAGIHTLRAVVTDEAGQTSTNSCTAQVDVKGGIPFFVGVYGGKERLFQEEPFYPGGRCAALLGAEIGIQPLIADHTEFEAAAGVKVNLRDSENTSIFGDVAINRLLGRGFVGGGLSAWDLTESDTRSIALLIQGGVDLSKDGRWQLVGQARAPFNEFGDIDSNYQIWGGFRFRPSGRK